MALFTWIVALFVASSPTQPTWIETCPLAVACTEDPACGTDSDWEEIEDVCEETEE